MSRPLEEGDVSPDFYREHASRYAEVARLGLQSVYIRSSHPSLKGDASLLERLKELAPGGKGLDAGCGSGARDVAALVAQGYDVYGIDAIKENIQWALKLHPELSDRVWEADLTNPLNFPGETFDFVMCNAVIQHMDPEAVMGVTLPEFARVLRPGGLLQLMFKNGHGVLTLYDKDYGVQRSFQLYDEGKILGALARQGLELVEAEGGDKLGGVMYFTDPKEAPHCVFCVRKRGPSPGP